jgi:hypothetical protein
MKQSWQSFPILILTVVHMEFDEIEGGSYQRKNGQDTNDLSWSRRPGTSFEGLTWFADLTMYKHVYSDIYAGEVKKISKKWRHFRRDLTYVYSGSGFLIDADVDPDPTFHSDADPHPDLGFQIKAQPLEKVLNRLIFHSNWLVICKLMRIRIGFWI